MDGLVAKAVRRDLKALAERDVDLAGSSEAAAALALAKELDKPRNSATSKSMCARALVEVMTRLRNLAPPASEANKLDDLSSRRAARLATRRAAP